MQLSTIDDVAQFNLESDVRDHLVGNETSCLMRNEEKMIGELWDQYSANEQDNLIEVLLNGEISDEDASQILKNDFKYQTTKLSYVWMLNYLMDMVLLVKKPFIKFYLL